MTQTALLLGASGKIGRHFGKAFQDAGWQVRRFQRGTDMTAAAMGCDVIVNGMNPPAYHDWQTLLPRITDQVLAAAKASGATIVFPGNVYVFGDQTGPWSETTPQKPVSKKGRIRAEIEARYRAAADEGVQTIILRAGDVMTPEVSDSMVDMVYLRSIGKGIVTALGDPSIPRAHAWLPDMGRAAQRLADKRADLEPFTDVPFPGYTFSINDFADAMSRQTGRRLRVKTFPWLMFTLASPVWELAREMIEMRYLFETPHRLDDCTFNRLLPDFRATPWSDAITQLVENRQISAHPA
jgi:nucleoside-diphosphate-sugar epimerase